jgi:integrase
MNKQNAVHRDDPSRQPSPPPRDPEYPAAGDEAVIISLRPSADSPRPVIELDFGILVYPPQTNGEPWRAVFTEHRKRKYRQGATEAKLAAKLEKVKERLSAGATNMEQPGADLIAYYLDPDRLPVNERWSRKHAHTQRRLCERFAAPVIGTVTCQDIETWHTQHIVNAAPTAGEGTRVAGMLSALVAAGIKGGYLANPQLAMVHWQAGDRPLPTPQVTVAGESVLWVDPAEIPAADDVDMLGKALSRGRRGNLDELMANTAAYSGLRWGELTALGASQVDIDTRVITVDRKVVEVAWHLYRGTQEPQAPQDDFPAAYTHRLPARRQARRPHPAGPRRAGRRAQPARVDLPQPEVQAVPVLQLQPQRPQARLRRGLLARQHP